jgi:DNA (cytosine-5)-methyltransferase 1
VPLLSLEIGWHNQQHFQWKGGVSCRSLNYSACSQASADFELGLERSGGFETVAQCEIDPFCRRVLAKHWPNVRRYEDVRELTADVLARDGIGVDAICGGFPCQDISIAGTGAGIEGERSGLWKEIARLVRELGPELVLLENVAALLGRGLDTVLGDLASLGYDAEWYCIPVGRLGAPHERDRVWIVAYTDSWRRRANLAGGDNANRANAGRPQADRMLGEIPLPSSQWHLADPHAAYGHGHGQRRRKYHRAEIAVQPQRTGLAGAIGHDGWETPWPRFLADICGVDDGLRSRLDKAGLAALGNTLSPQIPELIGRAILASLEPERAAA